jgi:hypothetical protein
MIDAGSRARAAARVRRSAGAGGDDKRNVVVAWVALAGAASAAQFDMAAIARWKDAKVVHYRIVGTFQGTTPIAPDVPYGTVDATDRVTVELDWDVRASKAVGEPKVTNVATQVAKAASALATCPPPAITGSYEHFDAAATAPHPAGVELKGTRSFPAARLSSDTTCEAKAVPARSDAVSEIVTVVSPMMLVMPAGANPNLSVAADRKSFTITNKGWSWTYTPSVVQ